MRTCVLWMNVLRCLVSVLVFCLSGCASHMGGKALPDLPQQSLECEEYVAAWVGHFKANVARLDGVEREVSRNELDRSRQALALAGVDEQSCKRPLCIIQPQAGGRLDSYCGYRVASDTTEALYRWVPWTTRHR